MKKVSIILWGLAALLVTAAVGVVLVIQFVLPGERTLGSVRLTPW